MDFNLTVTISAILGIAAVISPIATAIINNRYQLKLKKLELEQYHLDKTTYYVRSIFENYLRCAGKCINNGCRSTEEGYGEYYFLALVYAPSDISKDLIDVNSFIIDGDYHNATALLERLKPKLALLLQQL